MWFSILISNYLAILVNTEQVPFLSEMHDMGEVRTLFAAEVRSEFARMTVFPMYLRCPMTKSDRNIAKMIESKEFCSFHNSIYKNIEINTNIMTDETKYITAERRKKLLKAFERYDRKALKYLINNIKLIKDMCDDFLLHCS